MIEIAAPKPQRHRWPAKGTPFINDRGEHWKSERERLRGCGIIKVTRHNWSVREHWVEYWRGLELISKDKAPVCERVEVPA